MKEKPKLKKGDKVIIHSQRNEIIKSLYDGKAGKITDIWNLKRNPWGNICVKLPIGISNNFFESELEKCNE